VGKVYTRQDLQVQVNYWRKEGKSIVFTNGCFDILHRGHVEYLHKARSFGDILVIGINSDSSVKILKGQNRPIIGEEDRAFLLSQLVMVDAVTLFDEETPYNLIRELKPDILVKGGDYTIEQVVGRDIVEDHGGEVVLIPLIPGRSTTDIISRMSKMIKENHTGE